MKSVAIPPLPRSVILNVSFVVVYLPAVHLGCISSFSSPFTTTRISSRSGRHVRSDTRHRLEFRSGPGKFSGKMDIVRKAVEIRRRNVAQPRSLSARLAIERSYSWLYSFPLFATLFTSKYTNVYRLRPKFRNCLRRNCLRQLGFINRLY